MEGPDGAVTGSTEGELLINLYSSEEFLRVVANVYFPSQRHAIEDFVVDGKVFRLLAVDGRPLIGPQPFIDMHEPVPAALSAGRPRKLRGLAGVSHAIVGLDEFRNSADWSVFEGAPTVLWAGFEQWEDYEQLLRNRRVLADDQRRRRRLEEALGPLEFTSDDLRDDVLTTCFEWKSGRDREMQRIDAFAQEQTRQFFRELRARGLLRASTLRAGGQLMSIWLGAVYRERWSGWVFTFNPEKSLSKYSLGRQLLYPMLEESYRSGHREFDFSIGFEPYKLFFATHARAIGFFGTRPRRDRFRSVAGDWLKKWPWLYEKYEQVKTRRKERVE